MFKLFKNLKLRIKMQLSSILLIMVVFIAFIFILQNSEKINSAINKRGGFDKSTAVIRDTVFSVRDYYNQKISFAVLTNKFDKLMLDMNASKEQTIVSMKDKITEIRQNLLSNEKYRLLNKAIGEKVFELTAFSIKQSTDYINAVSQKLADPNTEKQVSVLERLVIMGATVNNEVNYNTRILFLRLEQDFTRKDELLDYLKLALQNVSNDAKRLANTPFTGMVENARVANIEIKKLVDEYIVNFQSSDQIKQKILTELDKLLADLNEIDINYTKDTLTSVQNSFMILLAILIVLLVIITLTNFVLSNTIISTLKLLNLQADKIAQGDLNVEDTIVQSKDELGKLAGSFHQMIVALKQKENLIISIAQGDLTQDIKLESENDQLGKSLDGMNSSLNQILSDVYTAINQVSAGSQQVARTSQALSSGATEQASALEEISSSMTEINQQTKQNADNASQVNAVANQQKEIADKGNRTMTELLASMSTINQSTGQIKKIVKIIDDIAFQINLLALNANVEAARAGKYGKGFAVVAEEVRNLAGKSAAAVKDTTENIDAVVKSILTANTITEKTADIFHTIMKGTIQVQDLIAEVALASQEQSKGLNQISIGLQQIEGITQDNAANAEETASSSEELSSQAELLKNQILRFKLKGLGDSVKLLGYKQ